jgi:hypothetical protein
MPANKSLKPTATRVTLFAEEANPAPHYGGLVPPLHAGKWALDRTYKIISWQKTGTTREISFVPRFLMRGILTAYNTPY